MYLHGKLPASLILALENAVSWVPELEDFAST